MNKSMEARYSISIETATYSHHLFDRITKKDAISACRFIAKGGSLSFPKEELKMDNAMISVYDNKKSEIIFTKKVK
jgi:hypothetical protein